MTHPTSRRVLLLEDGDSPHLLAAVRAFGSAGWQVGLGGRCDGSRAARSRWVRRRHAIPPPEDGLAGFAAGINAAGASCGYDLVFPADDAGLMALSEVRDSLDVAVPYPAHPIVLRAVDKLTLTRAAEAAGLAVPWTVEASTAEVTRARLPIVVKAALHWSPGTVPRPRHLPVRVCTEQQDVGPAVEQITTHGGVALLQECIDGELMAMTLVTDRAGAPLAVVQQETSMLTLRDTSARAVTVPVDPALLRGVTGLLGELGWFGLANLQFLRPPAGPPRLIDFNARFYGSLALSRAAGVNLPVLWAAAALGSAPGRRVAGRAGVRFQALEEDLRRARWQRLDGLTRDVGRSLAYATRATHTTWSATDPVPGLLTAGRVARLTTRRLSAAARQLGGR